MSTDVQTEQPPSDGIPISEKLTVPIQDSGQTSEANSVTLVDGEDSKVYLSEWRLHVVTVALSLAMFLPNFEISIVSTSLLTITSDLKGFNISSWVVNAYLITYTGLLIAWAKMSDIFGRKFSLMAALVTFMVFSGACGAAQTMTQLVIFRAFQGIGGSGVYSLGMIIFVELVPKSKYTVYGALIAGIFALALGLGPLCGGIISEKTTWRWVFLLNIPAGFASLSVLAITFPPNCPRVQGSSTGFLSMFRILFSLKYIHRVDFLGTGLLLGSGIFIVTAVQQVEVHGSSSSAVTISLLVLSGPMLVLFVWWEKRVTNADEKSIMEPVFPYRFFKSRAWMAMIMRSFFCGTVFTILIIQIPLRLQAVNGFSTLKAGTHLLPFGLLAPVGGIFGTWLQGKRDVPPIFVLFLGASIQTVAVAFLSTLPTPLIFWKPSLAYKVMAGFGVGMNLGSLVMLTPYVCQERDTAVATAEINQFRFLGGSVGFAIFSSAMFSYTRERYEEFLPPGTIKVLEETLTVIKRLQPAVQERVRIALAEGYNLQMKILIGFAALQIVATALMWEKKVVRIKG